MKIRKHAKMSDMINGTSFDKTILQPHICKFNQSPWDAISFSPPSTPRPSPPPPAPEVVITSDSVGNGSLNPVVLAADREAERVVVQQKRECVPEFAPVVDKAEEPKIENERIVICSRNDGKSWHCKKEAVKGNSLCEHHLSLLKSYYSHSANLKKQKMIKSENNATAGGRVTKPDKKAVVGGLVTKPEKNAVSGGLGTKRPRPQHDKKKPAAKSGSTSEFLYFSRFRSWRDKTTGGNGCEGSGSGTPKNVELQNNEAFGDEFSSDEDGDEKKKIKKARKPIKARSLKSLM